MKTVTVYHNVQQTIPKEEITRELNWYDPIKREMQIFNGGQLSFKYMEDEYLLKMGDEERIRRGIKTTFRLLPVVEVLKVRNYSNPQTSSDRDKIMDFYNDYSNYNLTEVSIDGFARDSITFALPDKEIDDFTYQLDRNNFSRYIVD